MIKHRLALLPSHCVPRKHTHMQVQEGVGGIRLFLLKLSPVLNCGLKEKKKETKKTHHTTKTPVWLLRVACSPTICAPGRSCSAPTHLQRLLLPEVLHNCTEREQSTELTSGQGQNYQWGWVCLLVSHCLYPVPGVHSSARDAGESQHASLLPLPFSTSPPHSNYDSASRAITDSFSWPE